MKKILPIALLSLTALACSESNQPKCTDEIVKTTLKEILANNGTPDTSAVSFEGITTTGKDEEFRMCECAANVVTEVYSKYDIVADTLLNADEEQRQERRFPITYKAQLTDDGESINVEIL
ncbi:hypothetical protein [Rufibacter ruber]|uniref:hypothetical protein n=1 Tax=Rufibacter ruber TaxID=1783499 RepID=UPI00083387EA|nr:hypothetical protein [Rufibacter ruber]